MRISSYHEHNPHIANSNLSICKIGIVGAIIMINHEKVKEIMFSLGADLCGIASIDRFDDAPKGYQNSFFPQ